MNALRRFLAGLLVSLLAFAPAETIAPLAPPVISVSVAAAAFVPLVPAKAHAATTAQNAVVLGGIQNWSLRGSSADLYFALNAGSCAINRLAKPCATLLSTTRASGEYCQWADNHFTLVGNNAPCLTDLGIGVWQASTNQALWARDMTNAAWVKVNMTVALTASGIDNGSNNASNLTATAGNATVLQTFTIGSIAETYSVFLERVSGSGNIQITENNGGTWTTADSSICTGQNGAASGLSTAYYVRCKVEATLANPVIGIRIVTSGDVVNADFSQDEEIAFATPPILTTTGSATRAADAITLTGAALTAALAAKAVFLQTFGIAVQSGSTNRLLEFSAGAPIFAGTTTTVGISYTNGQNATATIANWALANKIAAGNDSAGVSIIANGGSKGTATNGTPLNTGTVQIGGDPTFPSARYLNGYMRRLAFGPTKGQFDALTN